MQGVRLNTFVSQMDVKMCCGHLGLRSDSVCVYQWVPCRLQCSSAPVLQDVNKGVSSMSPVTACWLPHSPSYLTQSVTMVHRQISYLLSTLNRLFHAFRSNLQITASSLWKVVLASQPESIINFCFANQLTSNLTALSSPSVNQW